MGLPLPRFSTWSSIAKTTSTKSFKKSVASGVGQFFTGIANVVGFIFNDLIGGFMQWGATKIWSVLVAGAIFAMNFNWNVSDEDLEARFKAAEIAWWGQLGETIGTALGWTTCGLLPTAVTFSFNKALAAQMFLNVGEEAYEEMIGEISALVNMGARNAANRFLTDIFIGFRWMVKNVANDGSRDTLMQGIIGKILDGSPGLKEGAKKWGDKGGKPWILSQKIEEAIESLPIEQKYQEFLEELLEAFGESCIEAGYVVAGAIDEFIANQGLANRSQQGDPNTIVLTPNRLAPNQKFILHGTTTQLKPLITQTLANYQIIDGKDIGVDLGMPLIERAHKQISEYVITLFLKSKQKPPYGRDARQHQIKINSANKLKFTDFDKVIRALGGGGDQGNIGYMYGNFAGQAYLSDGSSIQVWCDTSENVKLRIEALSELTEAKIQTLDILEQVKDYQREKVDGLAKVIYRVYPWKIEVLRKTKIYDDYDKSHDDTTGRLNPTAEGYYQHSPPYTLELWQGQKPSNWDDVMAELTAIIPPAPVI